MTTEQVPTNGFNVPDTIPPAAQQAPGFVPPPPAGNAPEPGQGFSQAQLDAHTAAAVAAALAAAKPPTPAPAAQAQPAAAQGTPITSEANDPLLSSFTNMFVSVGKDVDMERALGKAIQLGRVDLIDDAYITEKGGANAEGLKATARAIVERVQYQTAQATTAAYTAAGGEAQWATASAAFNQHAAPHLKTVVATMLNSGDPATITSAAKMVVDYAQQGGLVVKPGQYVQSGSAAPAAGDSLSKEEFQAAYNKLNPQSRTFAVDRDALISRRTIGKQLGR